jgi:hypothetical protein
METVMDDWAPLSFLSRRLPASFERWVVVVAPSRTWIYDAAAWRDALVVVERGEIDLEHLDGSHHAFARGAMVWFDRLPLRALHNRGREPAVLVAVARRTPTTQR